MVHFDFPTAAVADDAEDEVVADEELPEAEVEAVEAEEVRGSSVVTVAAATIGRRHKRLDTC